MAVETLTQGFEVAHAQWQWPRVVWEGAATLPMVYPQVSHLT